MACAACTLALTCFTGIAAAQDAAGENPGGQGAAYAQALADADGFRRYNEHIERLVASQAEQIATLETEIAALDDTAAEIQPLLVRMFDSLAEFVPADLPFLVDERSERVDTLGALMARPDADISEKYRRLMEAYQIELNFGRDMEAYRGTLESGQAADFVRLGRVALLYRTVDGTEAGYWDAERGAFVADIRFARAINDALAIATETSAPDLVILPVSAPEETR